MRRALGAVRRGCPRTNPPVGVTNRMRVRCGSSRPSGNQVRTSGVKSSCIRARSRTTGCLAKEVQIPHVVVALEQYPTSRVVIDFFHFAASFAGEEPQGSAEGARVPLKRHRANAVLAADAGIDGMRDEHPRAERRKQLADFGDRGFSG